jgi:opine dehydrogenase
MAAHLSLLGFEVNLYNRSPERLEPLRRSGGIELLALGLEDVPSGFASIRLLTSNMTEALRSVEIIMVCVPATGHANIAEQCAPHLHDGQIVILNPGRTGGALEFSHILKTAGCKRDVTIAEAQTFLYACRKLNPAQVQIFRMKNTIPVAALKAYRTAEVVRTLRIAFPRFVPGDNVMKTSLENIGAVFHPAVTVFNAARIDSATEFEFYVEGITPSVAKVLEGIDRERIEVSEALGFRAMSAREWLYLSYSAAGTNLYEAIRANPGYKGISAPITLNVRYLHEDVPMSLVPIASLGDKLNVETPNIKSVIQLASALTGFEYWKTGRTVERLGLADLNLQQIRRLVVDGEVSTS